MSSAESNNPSDKARVLAERFDQSFALPRSGAAPARQDFIAVRIRDDPHVLRLRQLAELRCGLAVTRLPGSPAELLGLANLKGAVVPVYDLGLLLGYPPGTMKADWYVLAAMAPVAFAFDAFDGHLRLSGDISAVSDEGDDRRPYADQILRTADRVLPIIDLPSVAAFIARSTARTEPKSKGE